MSMSQLASAPPSSTTLTRGPPGVSLTRVVSGLESADQAREGLAHLWVALVAPPLGRAGGKDVVEPLAHEQASGRVEDPAAHGLAVPDLSFFDSHQW